MNIYEEKYRDKCQELREMLKFSIYSKEEIIQKIRNIQIFAKIHHLEVEDFNNEFILKIAQELQPFYDGLWHVKTKRILKNRYQKLSQETRNIYDEYEVEFDWERRRYSKEKYDEMMRYLECEILWLDELEARFKKYHDEQICYVDRKEYLLLWDQIVDKYQNRLITRKNHQVEDINFNLTYCVAGDFWMGSEPNLGYDDEKPRHQVKITKGFWMGESQVTQKLWDKVMGWNSSAFNGSGDLTIESVSWYDCLVFCNKLSELEKLTPCFTLTDIENRGNTIKKANVEWNRNANGYRLPTESEWEYCAKARSELIYSGSNHLDEIAWYHVNSGENRLSENLWHEYHENWSKYKEILNQNKNRTHEIKTKKANQWGLYDMSGNIWEWCMDQFDENAYQSSNRHIENPILWDNSHCERVVRGGSSWFSADCCRVAYRRGRKAGHQFNDCGFRLLRIES